MSVFEIIADDRSLITYRPKLNELTGSVIATILLQQILFHYKNNKYTPFYKFKLPCSHRLYSEGDSWSEELGFTRSEFDTALKKIASKTSKKDIENCDKFVSYYTTSDRLTYYSVNEDMLKNAVNQLYVKQESSVRKSNNPTLDLKTESSVTYTETTETTTESNNKNNNLKLINSVNTKKKDKDILLKEKEMELFNSLKSYLLNKYKQYHDTDIANFPKEMKALKNIIKKSNVNKSIINNKLKIFENNFNNPESKFWSNISFLPSMILATWDNLNPPRKIVNNEIDPTSEYEDLTKYKTKEA